MVLEPLLNSESRLLRGTDQSGVVDVGDTETGGVTLGPLEVVQEGPAQVSLDDDSVLVDGEKHGVEVVLEVLDAEVVVDGLFDGEVLLALDGAAVLGDVNGCCGDLGLGFIRSGKIRCSYKKILTVTVTLVDPVQQLPETPCAGPQPEGLALRSEVNTLGGGEGHVDVSDEVVKRGGGLTVLDVVGGVVVHTVEVGGTLEEGRLLLGEVGETVAELLAHGGGVVTGEVDGVGVPGDGELVLTLSGLNVCEMMEDTVLIRTPKLIINICIYSENIPSGV